jgi:hypothetical protein
MVAFIYGIPGADLRRINPRLEALRAIVETTKELRADGVPMGENGD